MRQWKDVSRRSEG